MYAKTLATARNDWAQCFAEKTGMLCADNLIALAVDCKRQQHWPCGPLTPEDAAIILRVAPAGLRIDEDGNYIAFGNGQRRALRYVLSLNS